MVNAQPTGLKWNFTTVYHLEIDLYFVNTSSFFKQIEETHIIFY